jgi:hypothetical protein
VRTHRSFVVNVYRRQAELVVGTVQDVQTGRTVPFQGMEELWQVIGRSPSRSERGSAPPTGGRRRRQSLTTEEEDNT